MADYTEIEARWINQDRAEIEQRLTAINAKKVGDYFFREWIFAHGEWRKDHRRIRVRTNGTNTWLTYKANATWEIDSTQEVELTVSSAENAVKLLTVMDIPCLRYQEKRRSEYQYNDITFVLDTWPQIPLVIEIEAPSKEKVQEGARLLELAWSDALFEDQKILHEKYFDIDLEHITDYRFVE